VTSSQETARQKRFYDSRPHEHLRAEDDDLYARKLAAERARTLGMDPGHRVLEVGAGFGRFTFPLLDHCGEVTALDLSGRLLDELEQGREERGIPPDRLKVVCSDVDTLSRADLPEPFDFVVGFFFLHHLPDFARTLRTLPTFVAPGGQLAFLEPNRRNPLFLAQVACCQDMTWRDEKGMFQLSAKKVEAAYRRAGLPETATRRFGFFPPQIFNRISAARRLEERIERLRWLEGVLPFLLLAARAPEGPV
jgi:SAM-dependent methyltransferase